MRGAVRHTMTTTVYKARANACLLLYACHMYVTALIDRAYSRIHTNPQRANSKTVKPDDPAQCADQMAGVVAAAAAAASVTVMAVKRKAIAAKAEPQHIR